MSKDISMPDDKPRWATSSVISPLTGVANTIPPPESKRNVGWNPLEVPSRNFENWLNLYQFLWIEFFEDRIVNRNPVTDGDGAQIFCKDDVLITLYAVDKVTPANYIHAVGYKPAGQVPALSVISSNVLTLAAGLVDGTQPVSGGAADDIIIYGQMQK